MRYIVKGEEPDSFKRWKRSNKRANWDNLSETEEVRVVKKALKERLIEEQHKMCCYCESALLDSTNAHIEHLKDKHKSPKEMFDYYNLLASCQTQVSCGHKKGTGYFEGMVTPLDEKCQSRFTYTGAGKIISIDEDDKEAERTIELLGLNCEKLVNRRYRIIMELDNDYADSAYFPQSLTECLEYFDGFISVLHYVADKKDIELPF